MMTHFMGAAYNLLGYGSDLRMAHSVMFVVETKHNSWGVIIWLIKCITCTIKEVESQISFLPYHFAPNDFTHLKHRSHILHILESLYRE